MARKRPLIRIRETAPLLLSVMVLLALVSGPIAARGGAGLGGLLGTIDETTWTEWPANPIVVGQEGYEAYYPTVLYDANQFNSRGDDAPYKMWVDKKLQYYTSFDGINWTFGGYKDVGLAGTVRHPLVEYYSDGFLGVNSGTNPSADTMYYRLWYWPGLTYSIADIKYAESPDGKTWYNNQGTTQGLPKIIEGPGGSSWNRGSYGPSDVLYSPGASNTGVDWTFRMYYDGTTGGDESLGVAFSNNGIHWVGYDPTLDGKADPVLVGVGGSGVWDGGAVATQGFVSRATVLKLNGEYKMWYSGGMSTMDLGIGYATSADGLVWTKHADNPVLHTTDGVVWRPGRTYTPMVIYNAASFSGNGDAYPYKMWFTGASADKTSKIGYATAGELADTTPPQTGVSPAGTLGGGGWYTSAVDVTLTAEDEVGGSGVEEIHYRLDGGTDTAVPGSTASFTLSTDGTTVVSYYAVDTAGNEESPRTVTVKIDQTPPAIDCALADGLWHASDVSIACTASDGGSGVATPADSGFSLTTSVAGGVETATAATGTHDVCDLAGHCATAGPIGGNKVDKKAPSIASHADVTAVATSTAGAVVTYTSPTATDGGSGVATALANCTPASGGTFPIGPTTVTCTATDLAGNPASSSFNVIVNKCPAFDNEVAGMIAALIANVDAIELKKKDGKKLIHELDKALKEIGQCDQKNACKRMDKFIKDVQKKKLDKHFESDEEAALLLQANAIKLKLGCS